MAKSTLTVRSDCKVTFWHGMRIFHFNVKHFCWFLNYFTCAFRNDSSDIHWYLCSAKGMLHRWLYHLPGCPRQHTGWIWRLQQWSNITFHWNVNVENIVSGPLSTNQVGANPPVVNQTMPRKNYESVVFSLGCYPGFVRAEDDGVGRDQLEKMDQFLVVTGDSHPQWGFAGPKA